MHIHTILHNVIYICVLSIFWYVVQQPQYWEEGGGGLFTSFWVAQG